MTRKKIIIGVVLLVIVAASVWYLFFRKPKVTEITIAPLPGNTGGSTNTGTKPKTGTTNTNTTQVSTTPPPAVSVNENFPLQVGSNGPRVALLQNALKRIKPSLTLPSNGIFDEATRIATITYVGTAYYPVTANNYSAIMIKSTPN